MTTTGTIAHIVVGDFVIDATYDESIRQFIGSVQNKPYPVRLTAPTVAEIESKFQTLLSAYLGVEAR